MKVGRPVLEDTISGDVNFPVTYGGTEQGVRESESVNMKSTQLCLL